MGYSRTRLFIPLTLVMIIINSLSSLPVTADSRDDTSTLPDWTVLMYMAGDNNLEDAAIDDFNELESVGSTSRVNIIAQIDRSDIYDESNGDWTETRRYKITKDTDRNLIQSEILNESMGELDMSDPDTLADFLLWGVNTYPAQRYLVVLWDHGLGWDGGVLNDHGYMSIFDLRDALGTVKSQWNNTFDLFGFDACLMGGIEVYYQLNGFVNYSFGSGKNEPTDGLPYNDFIEDLVDNPEMGEEELLEEMSSDYVRSYRDHSPISVHYAGIDIQKLSLVPEAVDAFVTELTREMPYYLPEVLDARNATEEYEKSKHYDYLDFMDFIRQIGQRIDNPRFDFAAGLLQQALNDSIVSHSAWSVANKESDTVRNSTGMTIFFPNPSRGLTTDDRFDKYSLTQFANSSLWDEFLLELFRYNDHDYRESRELHSDMTHAMEVIDSGSDGQLDTFSLNYNLNFTKGSSADNLTFEVMLVNDNGSVIHHQNITSPERGGVLSFNVEEYGFDNYSLHLFVWDEEGILQDHIGYVHDFQYYGVELGITMTDGEGNEIIPGEIIVKPSENITLDLHVSNLGNSRELFRLSTSGVPLKYVIDYFSTPFELDPGEERVFPMTIFALDQINSGTDTFHVSVNCLDNLSVVDGEFITLKVLKESSDDEDDIPDLYFYGLLPVILVVAVIAGILRSGKHKKELENFSDERMDPEVEELLNFTKNLTERDEGAIVPSHGQGRP